MYACICIYIHIWMDTHIYIYLCIYIHVSITTSVWMYFSIGLFMHHRFLVFKSEQLNWPVNSSPANLFMQLKESFLSSMCRHIPALSDLISQIFWV